MGAAAFCRCFVNKLYFGDNLDILREYVADESVDLIYLDPPFNSQVQYNVLFNRHDDDKSSAQAGAFRDTWTWGNEAEWAFQEIMKVGGGTARFIDALRSALNESDMMAYLVMMAVRLREMHSKLKPTGSLYLHCDPTASHYLKVVLDGVFGPENFRSEIVWRRSPSHNKLTKQYGPIHDVNADQLDGYCSRLCRAGWRMKLLRVAYDRFLLAST